MIPWTGVSEPGSFYTGQHSTEKCIHVHTHTKWDSDLWSQWEGSKVVHDLHHMATVMGITWTYMM